MEKRAAIFEDKADDDLTAKQYNEQYDEEQLAGVKKSLANLNETGTPNQRKSGDGSTEQARH
jgi:hypothetical protein